MGKYWNRVTDADTKFETWEKDGMQLTVNSALAMICPAEECEDFFERVDMMSFSIFLWTLLGIALGVQQGRQIVWDYFDRDEALWFLGWLGMVPTAENNEQLRETVSQMGKKGWNDGGQVAE